MFRGAQGRVWTATWRNFDFLLDLISGNLRRIDGPTPRDLSRLNPSDESKSEHLSADVALRKLGN